MSGSALTPSHENGSSWLATLPRTERMNAKAAKVAKAVRLCASLRDAVAGRYRGSPDRDSRGYTWWTALRPSRPCVHRRGCDRSLTRPWGEQSVAFFEQDAATFAQGCGSPP